MKETAQLGERRGIVLHPQVVDPIHPRLAGRLAADDEDGRRLPASDVSALRLGGLQRLEHTFRQVAFRRLERARHRGPDARLLHKVCLHAVVLPT